MGEVDDNVLVARVLSGDRNSFRSIVDRHQGRVFYLGLRFLRNLQDAEDFAQEVFIRAYRKLESFSGKVPFGAWLYRLAFNLAVNDYHVSRRRLAEVDYQGLPLSDPSLSPEAELVATETRGVVKDALKTLPDAYKIVIRMHFFDGLSYPEISRATGLPVNTIKSHVFRAKRLIRKQLGTLEEGGAKRREASG